MRMDDEDRGGKKRSHFCVVNNFKFEVDLRSIFASISTATTAAAATTTDAMCYEPAARRWLGRGPAIDEFISLWLP